jgi:hypothetical protein
MSKPRSAEEIRALFEPCPRPIRVNTWIAAHIGDTVISNARGYVQEYKTQTKK